MGTPRFNSSDFFRNLDCKYYPCHEGISDMNCLFCYCPLFNKEDCPGTPEYLENGSKDCSKCTFPHERLNYKKVIERLDCG